MKRPYELTARMHNTGGWWSVCRCADWASACKKACELLTAEAPWTEVFISKNGNKLLEGTKVEDFLSDDLCL